MVARQEGVVAGGVEGAAPGPAMGTTALDMAMVREGEGAEAMGGATPEEGTLLSKPTMGK